jgi:phosphoglycerate kinase
VRTLDDLTVAGASVLVRVDFNVPRDPAGRITDDTRIQAALPTISELLDSGARVVLAAHLGRPKGVTDPALSLATVATRLSELLGFEVPLVQAMAEIQEFPRARVLLLENMRFDPRETSKDADERAALARELTSGIDAFVSDGFGVVHRKQASVTDVATLVPSAAGRLVEREVKVFRTILDAPARPFVVILGGAKVSDKLGVVDHLIPRVDTLLIGGGMAYTFLAAQGLSVGDSLLEPDHIEQVRRSLALAKEAGTTIELPSDIVVADRFDAGAQIQVVPVDAIPDGWQGLDIGPQTAQRFSEIIRGARTVVWNGPMGVFEMGPFAAGTEAVARALVACPGVTVVGGGDSAAALTVLGVGTEGIDHVSTGGGASLEFLEGKDLPGLEVLEGVA